MKKRPKTVDRSGRGPSGAGKASAVSITMSECTFPEQDQMGQALLFNRSHPALRKSVQIRAARRQSQTLHARYCQGLAELSAELGIAIVQHVATAVQMSHPLQCRVASHLTHPARLRTIGDASNGDPPALQVNEK